MRSELDECVVRAGLAPLRVRVEAAATNLNTMRMLAGSDMLSLSSSWALDALARIGLPEMRRQIAWMTRHLGHRSPLLERMEQLLMQEFGRNRGDGLA